MSKGARLPGAGVYMGRIEELQGENERLPIKQWYTAMRMYEIIREEPEAGHIWVNWV